MILPPTYYDFINNIRPFILELAAQDVDDLLASFYEFETVHSVDNYNSRFAQAIDLATQHLLNQLAKSTGIPYEILYTNLESVQLSAQAHFVSLYKTINHEYHTLINFILSGKKTFHLHDNLVEHLANTEINLRAEMIQLPFSTCLFTSTSHKLIDLMYQINSKKNINDIDYQAPISVFLTVHSPDVTNLPHRKLLICAWHSRLPDKSYCMIKRELYLNDNWMLEQVLKTDWEELTPDHLGEGVSIRFENDTIEPINDELFYTDGLAFYRAILNAILYISSDQAELLPQVSPRKELEIKAKKIASVPKRKKVMKTAKQFSELDYNEVGASVKAIVIKKHSITDEAMTSSIIQNKLLVKFMVRGHWRHQTCGPKKQDRKLIWIRPYCKGPDLVEYINRPYIVN